MRLNKANLFFYPSAAIMLLTAAAKFYSATGDARVLGVRDQLLHLGYRPLMLAAGALEALIAVYLLASRRSLRRSVVLLWLASNFMAYHFGNRLLGLSVCPCLGSLTAKLPLPPGVAENLLRGCILFWFIGSFYIVWRAWVEGQTARAETMYARQLESKTS